MDDIQHREQLVALPRYAYPLYIKLFLFSLPVLFLAVVPGFVWYDLPKHKTIHARITKAHNAFAQGNYYDAALVYGKLLETHPSFKEARIALIKSCFALSDQEKDSYYYDAGLHYIGNERYELNEIFAMQEYAPQCYKDDFERRFTI